MIKYVTSPEASPPHGHYAHATVHKDVVYVCGLLGNSLDRHREEGRSVTVQTEQCLRDLSLILRDAGSDIGLTLHATVYVENIDDWPEINAVWEDWFGDRRPARAVVPGTRLRYGSAIELIVTAAVKSSI